MAALLVVLLCTAPAAAVELAAADLVGWWSFGSAGPAPGTVAPSAGGVPGLFNTSTAKIVPLLGPLGRNALGSSALGSSNAHGSSNASALRLFGNGSTFIVPTDAALDKLDELTFSFWIDFFWGDATLVQQKGFTVELYRQFLELEFHAADLGAGTEWKVYPQECAYLAPGEWHMVTVAFTKKGVSLYLDGRHCATSDGSASGSASLAGSPGEIAAGPAPAGYTETDNSYCSDHGGKRIWELKGSLTECAAKCTTTMCKCFDYNSQQKHCRAVDGVSVKSSSSGDAAYVKRGSGPAPPPSQHGDLKFGGWSGLLGDVRHSSFFPVCVLGVFGEDFEEEKTQNTPSLVFWAGADLQGRTLCVGGKRPV